MRSSGPRAARAALAVFLGAALAPLSCTRPAPPGLVLISLDTLRRDRLNCDGYARRRVSPHIDALARDSVLFENAVSASPWTTPSHMTLLTSLAPSSHGVLTPLLTLMSDVDKRKVERLPEARVTLAEALASRGFTNAAFTGGVTMHPAIGFAQGLRPQPPHTRCESRHRESKRKGGEPKALLPSLLRAAAIPAECAE